MSKRSLLFFLGAIVLFLGIIAYGIYDMVQAEEDAEAPSRMTIEDMKDEERPRRGDEESSLIGRSPVAQVDFEEQKIYFYRLAKNSDEIIFKIDRGPVYNSAPIVLHQRQVGVQVVSANDGPYVNIEVLDSAWWAGRDQDRLVEALIEEGVSTEKIKVTVEITCEDARKEPFLFAQQCLPPIYEPQGSDVYVTPPSPPVRPNSPRVEQPNPPVDGQYGMLPEPQHCTVCEEETVVFRMAFYGEDGQMTYQEGAFRILDAEDDIYEVLWIEGENVRPEKWLLLFGTLDDVAPSLDGLEAGEEAYWVFMTKKDVEDIEAREGLIYIMPADEYLEKEESSALQA